MDNGVQKTMDILKKHEKNNENGVDLSRNVKKGLTEKDAVAILQKCINYLQAEGWVLDIKIALKPLNLKINEEEIKKTKEGPNSNAKGGV